MNIGRLIKYYRTLHRLTQSEVAELSGINEKYLGRLERGESVPTIDKLEQICMAFDIRLCDMLVMFPERMLLHEETREKAEEGKTRRAVYDCNCCGCTFRSEENEAGFERICPVCGCRYDEADGYIEKMYSCE